VPFRVVPKRDRNLNRVIRNGRETSYVREQIVYDVGEDADDLYLVRDGHARLTLPGRGGEPARTVLVAGPGEIFGLEALEPDAVRLLGARAGEPSTLVALPGARTLRAIRTTTWTLPLLLSAANRDLARALWAGPGARGPSTPRRLADLLLELARRLGEPVEEGGGAIRIPHWLTHQELADLVGAHRSTVTTRINDWIYQDLLDSDGRALVVRRPDELERRGSGRAAWLSGVDPDSEPG